MILLDGIMGLFKEATEWVRRTLFKYSDWRLKKFEPRMFWFTYVANEHNEKNNNRCTKLQTSIESVMKFIVKVNANMPIIYGYWLGRYMGLALLKVLGIIIISDMLVMFLIVPVSIRIFKVLAKIFC